MNSSITINDRRSAVLSGVVSVTRMTDSSVSLFTEDGDLIVSGEGLETDEFDPASGIFRIRGRINSVCYTTDKRHLPDNFISRLFK